MLTWHNHLQEPKKALQSVFLQKSTIQINDVDYRRFCLACNHLSAKCPSFLIAAPRHADQYTKCKFAVSIERSLIAKQRAYRKRSWLISETLHQTPSD